MEDEEQSFWGSITDTLGNAVDSVSETAESAYETVVGGAVDNDHDGTAIDDVVSWGAKGAASIGGTVLGSVLGSATGPLGTVAGAATGAAVGYAGSTYLSAAGEAAGDFISDALGTRDEPPLGEDGCTDLAYKDGFEASPDNPDGGLGQ